WLQGCQGLPTFVHARTSLAGVSYHLPFEYVHISYMEDRRTIEALHTVYERVVSYLVMHKVDGPMKSREICLVGAVWLLSSKQTDCQIEALAGVGVGRHHVMAKVFGKDDSTSDSGEFGDIPTHGYSVLRTRVKDKNCIRGGLVLRPSIEKCQVSIPGE